MKTQFTDTMRQLWLSSGAPQVARDADSLGINDEPLRVLAYLRDPQSLARASATIGKVLERLATDPKAREELAADDARHDDDFPARLRRVLSSDVPRMERAMIGLLVLDEVMQAESAPAVVERPASWFAKVTSEHDQQLNDSTLRAARKRGNIVGRMAGTRWQYMADSVCENWPDHAPMIRSALKS